MTNMEKDQVAADIGFEVPKDIEEEAVYMGTEQIVDWCYEFMGVNKNDDI